MPSIIIEKDKDIVYVKYSHNARVLKINTGVRLHDIFWNNGMPTKNCPDRDNILSNLKLVEERLIKALLTIKNLGIEPTIERIQLEYHSQEMESIKASELWSRFEKEISKVKTDWGRNRAERIKQSFLSYSQSTSCQFSIKSYNISQLGSYIMYLLIHEEQEDEDIFLMVDALRIFLGKSYPGKQFQWMNYTPAFEVDNLFSLNEGEIRRLMDAELGGQIEEARDLFLFLATSGWRYKDSQVADPRYANDEEIEKFNAINPAWKVSPPLFEVSRRILVKYNGIPPQVPENDFQTLLRELFEDLVLDRPVRIRTEKESCEMIKLTPLYDAVTPETTRTTFITNCFVKGIPLTDVMIMSGHTDLRTLLPLFRHSRTLWGTPRE